MEECVYLTLFVYRKSSHIAPDINLFELQKTLDAQGVEVVENQKESVVGRKALADKTKGKNIHPFSTTRVPTLGQTSRRCPMKRRSTPSRAC
jgi:hypothetical protein